MKGKKSDNIGEVEKLLKKVNYIMDKLGDKKTVDVLAGIKDPFEKRRHNIHSILKDVDTEVDRFLANTGSNANEIKLKYALEDKINETLKTLAKELKELENDFKKSKSKDATKEKSKNILQEYFDKISLKFSNQAIDETKFKEEKNYLQQLDDILMEKVEMEQREQRELYQEEINKMNEWDKKREQQDIELGKIRGVLADVREDAIKIGDNEKRTGMILQDVKKSADQAEEALETTNKKLKDLLNKIRSGDKICIDIVLVLVCLGLIAVLYNIIKTKFFGPNTPTPTSL